MTARSKHLAVLATALMLGTGLAACGSDDAGSPGGKTTITFWDDNGGPARTPVWQHIIAEFQKANPTITVKYVGIPIAQAQQKYDTAIAGGGLPDVGGVSTAMLSSLVAQKALEPLDGRISGGALNGRLNDQVVTSVKATVPDGKTYMVPMSTNMGVFWYRTDWFGEAGLEPPRNWGDFFTATEKLTDTAKNRYGFTIRGGAGSIAQMLEVVYGQSGITEIFDADGKATVNDPKNVAALEKLAGLYKKVTPEADVSNDYVKMVAQFDGGNIAIMQHNLGSFNDHVKTLGKDKVAAMAVPKSDGGVQAILSNPVSGIGLFASGEKKDAAYKFAEFAASKAMNSHWAEKTGVLPANTEVNGEAWIQGLPHIAEAVKVLNDPATKVVQMPYYLPEFNAITKTDMEPEFQKVLQGTLPAKDFLDAFAAKLTEAQASYKQRNGG
ncbi:ABC transporter substrate-binding protein [Streptosporangium roseum]|uniref:ABC-type sugar transport system periplasmic component-like protein n=1 Tax=Streptosporangium roseum (strain ATCC 12428 / DSM 43021 / JCM 3005 / KCTC 9067 / NCIMB 10171 / NRRL 2505 / NI 9100) TaxID=479432 RepID=D2AQE3_STRRD|nr:sugar ABC transporter substrate-binding protein [Streptosporangium roseum]ACZ84487.1 ABC-type sugar transport system periplasmic component-like protein [Streptosporangium roseum DSM 43021]